jgi:phosphate transport system substrate-binding protein
MDGSTTVGPIGKAFAEYYMKQNPGVNVTVSESGSGNGAKSIINKTAQIGMMSRFMKVGEFKAAAENGVMPVVHVVALDGLPILVHPSNPVKDLTVEQVRNIYAGKIKNWREVGGPNQSDRRDQPRHEQRHLRNLLRAGHDPCRRQGQDRRRRRIRGQQRRGAPARADDPGRDRLCRTRFRGQDRQGAESQWRGMPSEATVRTGEYRDRARAVHVHRISIRTLGSHLYRFMNLHLTQEGEEMVKAIGFVPCDPLRILKPAITARIGQRVRAIGADSFFVLRRLKATCCHPMEQWNDGRLEQ